MKRYSGALNTVEPLNKGYFRDQPFCTSFVERLSSFREVCMAYCWPGGLSSFGVHVLYRRFHMHAPAVELLNKNTSGPKFVVLISIEQCEDFWNCRGRVAFVL